MNYKIAAKQIYKNLLRRQPLLLFLIPLTVFTISQNNSSYNINLLGVEDRNDVLFADDTNLYISDKGDAETKKLLLDLKNSIKEKKGLIKSYNSCLNHAKELKQRSEYNKAYFMYYEMEKILINGSRNDFEDFKHSNKEKSLLLGLYQRTIDVIKRGELPQEGPVFETIQNSLNFITAEIAKYNLALKRDKKNSNSKIKIPLWMDEAKASFILLEGAGFYESINNKFSLEIYKFASKFISDHDKLGVVYTHIGTLNYAANEYKEAIKNLEFANKMNIRNDLVKFCILCNLASCYEKINNRQKTLEMYKEMLSRKYKKYISDEYAAELKLGLEKQ